MVYSFRGEDGMKRTFPGLIWGIAICALAGFGCAGPAELMPAQADADAAANIIVLADADVAAEPAGAPVGPACVDIGQPGAPTQLAMLEALNAYRAEQGLTPLIYSKRLEAAANGQVVDLWQRGFFAHVNPDGLGPGERAVAVGFCHKYVGENLAAGQKSVGAVMTAWKNSPGHNENMLEPRYVYVGVSYSTDTNGRMYWAQEFAYDLP